MTKLFGALAATILALMLLAPPAEARCWWNGYRWHCTHYRHYHHYYHHYVGYPYHSYGYYPYGYYPYRTYGYYPLVCVGPFCL